MYTMNSILLYSTGVWADTIRVKRYSKHRSGSPAQINTQSPCPYSIFSRIAVIFVVGVITQNLLDFESDHISPCPEQERKRIFAATIAETLQALGRWDEGTNGHWTFIS